MSLEIAAGGKAEAGGITWKHDGVLEWDGEYDILTTTQGNLFGKATRATTGNDDAWHYTCHHKDRPGEIMTSVLCRLTLEECSEMFRNDCKFYKENPNYVH